MKSFRVIYYNCSADVSITFKSINLSALMGNHLPQDVALPQFTIAIHTMK